MNLKIVENNTLVNEILKIKNEYVNKYNEMLELIENARKKKEVNDIMIHFRPQIYTSIIRRKNTRKREKT